MRAVQRLTFASSLAATMVASAGAWAASADDAVTAEALFREARSSMERGDYAAACPKFGESERLDPSVGTRMNLAQCEEHDGRLAAAWEMWHEVIDGLPAGDDRLAFARARWASLDRRVPRLTVQLAPGALDGRVDCDGVTLGRASFGVPLPIDPGHHVIHLSLDGRAPLERAIDVAEGQSVTVTLGGDDSTPAARVSRPEPASQPLRTAGFVALGVGGASLLTAVLSAVFVAHQKSVVDSECAGQACPPDGLQAARAGKSWLLVNTVASVATLAAGASGLALILVSNGSGTTRVKAGSVPSGAGVFLQRAF